jgi:transposase
MGAAISLRADFDAEGLGRLARKSKHAAQARRLLALALIYGGGSRSVAARLGNVTLQIVRDWVLRFNANGPDDDAHAILVMDQAGWHMSNNLVVPDNITILPLPPKSPELNPVENLWLFMRENWLSNRIFKSYDNIVDHCCDAWRKLETQPWRIMSIGRRDWANGF